MLWVYAENDHYFSPALAKRFNEAFTAGGGKTNFIIVPPFGEDGHTLFSGPGIPRWTPLVDGFLENQNLVLRRTFLPPPGVSLKPPPQLSASGLAAFNNYLASPPHKAFAASADGHFGWRSGQRTVEEAKTGALGFCKAVDCRIVVVDDEAK
jgi:hypothetical protein